MTMNRNVNKFHTTIGELIVALSDAAFEVCAEKRDPYLLVALALKHLLGRAQLHLPKLMFCDAKRNSPTPHFVTVRKYWESSLFLSVTI